MPIKPEHIVLASSNQGKIKEIQTLLPEYQISPQKNFTIQDALETGGTFIENAIIKARHAALHSGLPAIADDSGLVVKALHGAPGLKSARYAGEQANDQDNIQKLLLALKNIPDIQRQAYFICIIVLLRHASDPLPIIAQGMWSGKILLTPQGTQGFGYDPVFWVTATNCSSAELTLEQKNSLSHRGQALQNFKNQLYQTFR